MTPKGIEPANFLALNGVPQPTTPPPVPMVVINSRNTIALTADIVKYEQHMYLFISPACYTTTKILDTSSSNK